MDVRFDKNETAYFGYVSSIHSKIHFFCFKKYVALGMRLVILSKSTHSFKFEIVRIFVFALSVILLICADEYKLVRKVF